MQFISYRELQETAKNQHSSGADVEGTPETAEKEETLAEGETAPGNDEGQEEEEEDEKMEEASHLVENIKVSNPRRGTEVRLLGLCLGENMATVAALQITVCLQCNR